MDKGETIKFAPMLPEHRADEGPVEWLVNITDTAGIDYYLGVLKAAGYLEVSRAETQREIWDRPDGTPAGSVHFLFKVGSDRPVATSTNYDAVGNLLNALNFIEDGANVYRIVERERPLAPSTL